MINLNGAPARLMLMRLACMFVDNVTSLYVFGGFTRSIGLVFSRRGLERFLDRLPIDTHIDLFLDRLVRERVLFGVRTCETLVSNYDDNDDVSNSGRPTLPCTKRKVNSQTTVTLDDWLLAESVYREAHGTRRR